MAITSNPFEFGKAVDLSSGINLIPNQWGLMQRLGLFKNVHGSQKTILIPRTTEGEHLLEDRNWDERNQTIAGRQRDILALPIPHFPVDDAITPNDIDGNIDLTSAIASGLKLETIEDKRVEKMERIRRAHSLTLEMARMLSLKDGSVYAPNRTVVINYYQEFGITRTVESIDLASTTVVPNSIFQEIRGKIQDQLSTGDIITDFIALCSPEFFNALTDNPFVQERFLSIQTYQQIPLMIDTLAAGSPLDARYNTFDYAGITFIEVRGNVAGVPYVDSDEAILFPRGLDAFETHFAPANRLGNVNKTALESYYFEYLNRKDDIIEIMAETNFLNVLKRPELVITLRNEP